MKCSLPISNFLEQISSLSCCFPSISLHWELRKAFEKSLLGILSHSTFSRVCLSFLLCLLLLFLSKLFVRPSQTTFLYLFLGKDLIWCVQIKKRRSWHSIPLLHGKYMEKQWKQWQALFSWAPKSLQIVTAAVKKKTLAPWKKSYEKSWQHTKKQRHYFTSKSLYTESHGFSRSSEKMWELDHKESWAPKNWCFCTAVLDKILESPLDCIGDPTRPS